MSLSLEDKIAQSEKETARMKAIRRRFPETKIIHGLYVSHELNSNEKAKFFFESRIMSNGVQLFLFKQIFVSHDGEQIPVRSQRNVLAEHSLIIDILNAPQKAKDLTQKIWATGKVFYSYSKE